MIEIVIFDVGASRLAVPLGAVERVLLMLAHRPVPGAPGVVTGVIDLHGSPVPLIDVRRRLRLRPRAPQISDRVLVLRCSDRTIGLAVDDVLGVRRLDPLAIAAAEDAAPGAKRLLGVAAVSGELLFLYDPEAFLSLPERRRLDRALSATAS